MKNKLSLNINAWKLQNLFFIAIYSSLFIAKVVAVIGTGLSPFRFVTSLLLYTTYTSLILLFFKKTQAFALKYVLIPWVIFAWIVLMTRLGFVVFDGFDWLGIVIEKYHRLIPKRIADTADFFLHFVPLFIGITQFFYHKQAIESFVINSGRMMKLYTVFAPFGVIILWSLWHNPFSTYLIPNSMATKLAMYVGMPVASLIIAIILCPKLFNIKYHVSKKMTEFLGLVASSSLLGTMIYTKGIEQVYMNPLVVAALLFCSLFVGLIFNMRFAKHLIIPCVTIAITLMIMRFLFLVVFGDSIHVYFPNYHSPYELLEYTGSLFLFVGIITPILHCLYYRVVTEIDSTGSLSTKYVKNRYYKIIQDYAGLVFMVIFILVDPYFHKHFLIVCGAFIATAFFLGRSRLIFLGDFNRAR